MAVYKDEFPEQRSSALVWSAVWQKLRFNGRQTVHSYGADISNHIKKRAVMSDMKLTVQCMQHESVIAHSYACSVDAFVLWLDNIANAI